MSFLTDVFEGNFGNLGTDIVDAPSSLANHPDEIAETVGTALALTGIGAGIGGAIDAGAVGADVGATAADAGIAGDVAAGAGDITAGGLGTAADVGATAADLGVTGTDVGTAADVASGLVDTGSLAAGGDLPALAFSPDLGGDPFAASSFDITGTGLGSDVLGDPSLAAYTNSTFDPSTVAPAAVSPDQIAPTAPAGGPVASPTGAGGTNLAGWESLTSGPGIGADVTADPAVAAYETGTPGGITSTLGSVLSSPWTRLAAGIAPLALTLGMGQPSLSPAAQQLQAQATALQQTGLTNLAQAQAGVLNAGQTATISKMQQDLTNQWRQTLYNQGVTDISKDARWPQIQAQIDQQVTAATTQMIQQNINTALAETGQASQALTSIAQMQMQADQNFTNNLIGATKALGLAVGAGTRTTTTTVTA